MIEEYKTMVIQASFEFTPEQLLRATRLSQKLAGTQKTKSLYSRPLFWIFVLGGGFGFHSMTLYTPELASKVAWLFYGAILGIVAICVFLYRGRIKPVYEPLNYSFFDEGIKVESSVCTSIYPWRSISEVVHDTKIWSLQIPMLNKTQLVILIDANSVTDQLRELITSKVEVVIDLSKAKLPL